MTPEPFPGGLLRTTQLLTYLTPRIAVRIPGRPDGLNQFLFGSDGLPLPMGDLLDDAHFLDPTHTSRLPDASRWPDAGADRV